jgi:ATP-dependent DNA helicase RecQ
MCRRSFPRWIQASPLSDSLAAAREELKRVFGFDDFRPGQSEAVEALLGGRDVLAVMPTGAGKSMCYQIPALLMDGLTIVVSPLVALMEDQVAALKLNGVAAETINSARDRETNVEAWQRVAAGETRLLYLSPERLMTGRMISALQRLTPAMFAVDEAHCISRWGAAFRPEYEQLGELRHAFPDARLAAFTATADPATREDIARKLFDGSPETLVAGFDRPNIALAVQPRTGWQDQLMAFLEGRPDESGIIYALSRKNVDQIASFLADKGVNALPYHAGMDAGQRNTNQDRFMTESPVVMVATIAFGMGIDKPDIRFVVHTHLPSTIEAYYQEIGRAGRDGAPADAMMLFGLDDLRLRRRFIDDDGSDDDTKRREHKRLDALVAYAEASSCRRVMLLEYFGDDTGPCGNCDVCLDPPTMMDATEPAQKALSVIDATGQRFGAVHIIDIVRGSENQRVIELGHDRLPEHGYGADKAKPWWQAFLRQLISAGHLSIDIQGFGGIQITASGQAILEGQAGFECRQVLTRPAKSSRKGKSTKPEVPPEMAGLFDRLKAHRLELAKAQSVPPYVIFHDRTLIAMSESRPASREAFLELPGVGKSKADRFADSFMAVLKDTSI